jgi:hypothetical protein
MAGGANNSRTFSVFDFSHAADSARNFHRVGLQAYDIGAELVSSLCHVSIFDCASGKEGAGTDRISDGGGGGVCTGVGVTNCLAQPLNSKISTGKTALKRSLFKVSIFCHFLNALDERLLFHHVLGLRRGECRRVAPFIDLLAVAIGPDRHQQPQGQP